MVRSQRVALALSSEDVNHELIVPPRQLRSRASLMRILKAAEIVLREEGLAAFSIGRVAELSGVSVGGIYRRVKGKAELLQAIKDAAMRRLEDAVSEALRGRRFDGFEPLLHALVRAILKSFVREETLHRMLLRVGGADPVMSARGAQGRAQTRELFVSSALPLFSDPTARRARQAAALTYDLVALTFIDLVRGGGGQERRVSWRALGDELVFAGAAYLAAADRALAAGQSRARHRPVPAGRRNCE